MTYLEYERKLGVSFRTINQLANIGAMVRRWENVNRRQFVTKATQAAIAAPLSFNLDEKIMDGLDVSQGMELASGVTPLAKAYQAMLEHATDMETRLGRACETLAALPEDKA